MNLRYLTFLMNLKKKKIFFNEFNQKTLFSIFLNEFNKKITFF
jgi:hypothetical protein